MYLYSTVGLHWDSKALGSQDRKAANSLLYRPLQNKVALGSQTSKTVTLSSMAYLYMPDE